jgi:VanZ family protein
VLPQLPPTPFTRCIHAPKQWRVIFVVLVVAVGYLALTPQPPQKLDTGWDKLNHVLAFAALACAVSLGWPLSKQRRLWLLVGLILLGGLIEVLQLYVPGRFSEWQDLLADTIGVTLGAAIASMALSRA